MSIPEPSQPPATGITPSRRRLHWLVAALALVTIACGLWISWLRPQEPAALVAAQWRFSLHKTLGVALWLLTLIRLAAMTRGGFAPAGGKSREVFAAAAVQSVMLAALVLLPVLGLLQHLLLAGAAPVWLLPEGALRTAWQWLDIAPAGDPRRVEEIAANLGAAHRLLAWTMLAALALHIGGAAIHALVFRDGVFARMAGGSGVTPPGLSLAGRRVRRRGQAAGLALACVAACLPLLRTAQQDQQGATVPQAATRPAITLPGGTPNWIADSQQSLLLIEAVQGGTPFNARFTRFDVDIALDPERPETGRIEARIHAASFVSGLAERDNAATGPDWLDAARHPLVRWTSSHIRLLDTGRYRASGLLTLGASSAPVDLDFSLRIEGATATAHGEARFARSALQLGRGETGGADFAGPYITVRITIRAQRR